MRINRSSGDATSVTCAVLVGLWIVGSSQNTSAQNFTTATAVNNVGTIAGGMCVDDCNGFHATLIGRQRLDDFGTFGGPASVAYGVNDRGAVVGQSDTALLDFNGVDYISLAFLADQDGVRSLGTLPGYRHSQAFGINNRGQIVGWSYNFDPIVASRTVLNFHAFTYEDRTMRDLGTLGGNFRTARAINAQGWIVGGSRLTTGQMRAFVVIQGVMHDLGTLGGSYSEAFAINNTGLIVGAAHTSAEEPHAFALNHGTMTDLGTLGGAYSNALGVNELGDVVGESETASGEIHAFRYRNGVIVDLTAP